jgi:1-acyl-sn-glycerol-3-phosphate acyltransferase
VRRRTQPTASIGALQQLEQRVSLEVVLLAHHVPAHQCKSGTVLVDDGVRALPRKGLAGDPLAQLPKVVAGGDGNDERAGGREHPRALRRIAPAVHRGDDPRASAQEGEPPIRVCHHPYRRGESARGAFDRHRRQVDTDSTEPTLFGEHAGELAAAASEVDEDVISRDGGASSRNVCEHCAPDAACEQRRARKHRRSCISGRSRPPILRLQKIDVAGAGDVERVAGGAGHHRTGRLERQAAAAHSTGQAGRLHERRSYSGRRPAPPVRVAITRRLSRRIRSTLTFAMPSTMSSEPESSSQLPRWRGLLLGAITRFLSDRDPQTLADIRAALEHEIDAAGPGALVHLGERLAKSGTNWGYNPPDPLARRIHQVLANWILKPDSALVGGEHGTAVAGKPVVLFANHLSYSDANVLEVMLHRSRLEVADRLTVVAGPKVYSSPKRRFSSLCFGTIKTPQPPTRASENAVMPLRDLVRAARQSIEIAHDRLARGEALLIFGEGTRSRTRELQLMMKGVDRYLDPAGTWVMPVGITGSDEMYPIGDDTLYPVRIVVTLGRPVDAQVLRDRCGGDGRVMMDAVGLAIASLLPPEYRGTYDDAADLGEARAAFDDLWG